MANGVSSSDPQKNHTRFIVGGIIILGLAAIVCGSALIWKGYNGDLLIGGGLSAISGLCGFLGAGRPQQPPQDITVSAQPPKVELTKPEPSHA